MITAEFEFPQTKHADPLTKLYNTIKSSQKQGKKTDANSGASPKVEPCSQSDDESVSYTHLTLPTIAEV